MERMIIWWDELDDVAHAARHLIAVTASGIVYALRSRTRVRRRPISDCLESPARSASNKLATASSCD